MRLPPGSPPDAILLTFPVAREFAGQRLDRFLQHRIPRISRTRAQEIIRSSARREDGRGRRPGERVQGGEVVILVREGFEEPAVPMHFDVLAEDERVLVLDKPPGLPMHPTATYHRNTLTRLLRSRYGDAAPSICHRLDRETSGVVLCAKTYDAERALKLGFERRQMKKSYLAIVRGEMVDDEGEVSLPLARVREGLHLLMEVRDDGETSIARTRYRVLGRRDGRSLVHLFPETGRQHQLRVHLAAIGHPIVGDKLYGPEREAPFLELIETGMTPSLLARLGHDRHALHAFDLVYPDPLTGAPTRVEAPLAADLAALWAGEPASSPAAGFHFPSGSGGAPMISAKGIQ